MFAVKVYYANESTLCPWVRPGKPLALCSHPERWGLAEARAYVDANGGSVWSIRGCVKKNVYERLRPAP